MDFARKYNKFSSDNNKFFAFNSSKLLNASILSGTVNSTIFSSKRGDLHDLQERFNENSVKADENSTIRSNDLEELRFFYIKTKDNSNKIIKLAKVQTLNIEELKKFAFPTEFMEKNIRLIYNGRLLQDTEKIEKINFEPQCFVHAFISEKVEKREKTVTDINTNENQNNLRGFERYREYGLSREECLLQKFAFHSHFVMTNKNKTIDCETLIGKEDDYFALNLERFTNDIDVNWFRQIDFYEQHDPEKYFYNNTYLIFYIIAIIFAFFVFVLCLPLLFTNKIKTRYKEGFIIGIICKLIYITIMYIVLKEFRSIL